MAAAESKEAKDVNQAGGVRETENDGAKQEECTNDPQEEQELERLAVESLLTEARRGKARAENVGTMGWVKRRQVNKRFLNSIVLQTVSSHAKRKCFDGEKTDVSWTQASRGESEARRHSRASERRKETREMVFRERKRERGDSQKQSRDIRRKTFTGNTENITNFTQEKAGRNDA